MTPSRRYTLRDMSSGDGNNPDRMATNVNSWWTISGVAPILSKTGGSTVQERRFHALNACINNWEEYRILSATLVYISHSANNVGTITVVSSRDANDNIVARTSGPIAVGGSGVTFPAGLQRPKRIPLKIDTSWKKVSTVLMRTIGTGTDAVDVPVNSLNDIAVGGFTILPSGGVATEYYNIEVDFDIETRGPRLGAGAA